MQNADFEERAYEAPLYNQLERGETDVFTPGQVFEGELGFDRGIYVADTAVWNTLGFDTPPSGAALGYYAWPLGWGPSNPRQVLPRFRLNLFLQAKRPRYHQRRPRSLTKVTNESGPMWSFSIDVAQQSLLEILAQKVGRQAHVSYACAAFHTYKDLYRHTKSRTIVDHSTFPRVETLRDHEAWYYWRPGAEGVANPDPEVIEEGPLLPRVRELAADREAPEMALEWILDLDDAVTVATTSTVDDARSAQFMDDLQTLDRLLQPYGLDVILVSYAHVQLFVRRFDITWLVMA